MMTQDEMRFVRFRDPNEALGLAVRLLAGTDAGPFEHLPLGVSARMLTVIVDRGDYGFAQLGSRAVGFVAWAFVPEETAEGYLTGAAQISAADFGTGPAGVVFAFRAIDARATRFLAQNLRDVVFVDAPSLRFVRDYGRDAARKPRSVRLQRARPSP